MQTVIENLYNFIAQDRGISSVVPAPSICRPVPISIEDTSNPNDTLPVENILFSPPQGALPMPWSGLPKSTVGSGNPNSILNSPDASTVTVSAPKVGVLPSTTNPSVWLTAALQQTGAIFLSDVYFKLSSPPTALSDVRSTSQSTLLALTVLDELVKRGCDDTFITSVLNAIKEGGASSLLPEVLGSKDGLTSFVFIGLLVTQPEALLKSNLAASDEWWGLLNTLFSVSSSESSQKAPVSATGTLKLSMTTIAKDVKGKKNCISRLTLYPFPLVDQVQAEADETTSHLKLISCNAPLSTQAPKATTKTGWAKHAIQKGDKSFVTTISSHQHSRKGTIRLSASPDRGALLVCGELMGSLSLHSTCLVSVETDWNEILWEVASIAITLSLQALLGVPQEPTDPAVSFLLSTGTASDPTNIDENKLASTFAMCRANGDDSQWRPLITKLATAVTHLSGDFNAASNVVRQRWLLHWRPVLQGEDNEIARTRLGAICDFITHKTAKGTLPAAEVLGALFKMVEKSVTPDDFDGVVSHAAKLCVRSQTGFSCLQQMPIERAVSALSPLLSNADVSARFAGGPSELSKKLTCMTFETIAKALSQSTFCDEALQSAVTKFAHESRRLLAQALPEGFWTSLLHSARKSEHIFYNTIHNTAAGARITAAPQGGIIVDSRRMGDVVVRATQAWPVESEAVRYMEVTFTSDGYQKVCIGLSHPIKQCDTLAKAATAPYIFCANDFNTQLIVGKDDILGCGIFGTFVVFTFNGILIYKEPLRTDKQGVPEHSQLIPFVFAVTTNVSSALVNFGEAPYAFKLTDQCHQSNSLLIEALSKQTPLFDSAFASVVGSSAAIPQSVRNALRKSLSFLEDEQATLLADRLTKEEDAGGDLMAELLNAFDSLDTNYSQLAESVIKQGEKAAPIETRCHTMQWASCSEHSAILSGNVAIVNDEDQPVAHCFGSVMPFSEFSFTIALRRPAQVAGDIPFIGSVYVGVSAHSTLDLIGWKHASPHQAWAIHRNVREQLSYAQLPPRTSDMPLFNDESTLVVIVNRLKGTVSFICDGDDLGVVFRDVPAGVELRPFVQLVGHGSSAFALDCRFDAPVLASLLQRYHRISLLRSLLVNESSSAVVSQWLEREMGSGRFEDACAILGAVPEASYCVLSHPKGPTVVSLLYEVSRLAYRVRMPNGVEGDVPSMFLLPNNSFIAKPNVHVPAHGTDAGVVQCLKSAVAAVMRWHNEVLMAARLAEEESSHRKKLEKDALTDLRSLIVLPTPDLDELWSRNSGLLEAMLSPIPPPPTYTFSISESHPDVLFPAHYNGSLMLAPQKGTESAPYMGLGNESIPAEGQFNIRVIIDRDWMGMLPYQFSHLGEDYVVGVCTQAYKGEPRQHSRGGARKDLWAIPAIGTKAATLPNSTLPPLNTRNFNSMERIRLCINRDKGTMELFVTPLHGAEQSLGIAFKDIPIGVDLYPFVQLKDSRSSALLLPEMATLPRPISNSAKNLSLISKGISDYECDGCSRGFAENAIRPPNWFKCNQCMNYDLCQECYSAHVHPGHTFTHMTLTSALASPMRLTLQPETIKQQQLAEVAAPPLRLAKLMGSATALTPLSFQNAEDGQWAAAVWAVFRRPVGKVPTEVRIRFNTLDAANAPLRAVFGVGTWSDIKDYTDPAAFTDIPKFVPQPGKFRSVVASDTNFLSSDSRYRTTSVEVGVEDVLSVSYTSNEVKLYAKGVCVSTHEVSFGNQPTCIFVSCRASTLMAVEVFHPNGELVSGKICERAGSLVRVAAAANSRWCAASQLREPLSIIDTAAALTVGLHVYIADDAVGFKECVVCDISQMNDNIITLDDGATTFPFTADRVWVPSAVNATFKAEVNQPYREEKARMRRFYKKYAPEKTDDEMDAAIQKFSASTIGLDGMFAMLVKKYGPEPSIEIVKPIPYTQKQYITEVPTAHLTAIGRLLFILKQNAPLVEATTEFKAILQAIGSVVSPAASSLDILIHPPNEAYVPLDKSSAPPVHLPQSPKVESQKEGEVEFVLEPASSHGPIRIVLRLSKDGSATGEFLVPEDIGSIAATVSPTETGTQVIVKGQNAPALQEYLTIRERRGSYRTGPMEDGVLLIIETLGNFAESTPLNWWSVGGHHGYGTLFGALSQTKTNWDRINVRKDFTPAGPSHTSLNCIARAAANTRSAIVSPGDADVDFIDVQMNEVAADHFCSLATTDQLSIIYTQALGHAQAGRHIALLPVIAKHLFQRTKDTEAVLLPMINVVHKNWRNANLLRGLSTFGSSETKSVVAPLLLPLCRHFDILARNKLVDNVVQGAAIDAFFALGLAANYLPLTELSVLQDIASNIKSKKPLPSVKTSEEGWKSSIGNAHTLTKGTVITSLPTLTEAGVYFEVVQPAACRVIITLGDKEFTTGVSFDGMNAKRLGRSWKPFGYIVVQSGDILGCLVKRNSVTFSVNTAKYPSIPIGPVTHISVSADLSDAPVVIYSSAGSTQYTPAGTTTLHKKELNVTDYLSERCESEGVSDALAKFIETTLGKVLPFVDRTAKRSISRQTLISLKEVVSPEYRRGVLAPLRPLSKGDRQTIPTVSVKWYQLFSPTPRSADDALRASVLSQLHSQLTQDRFYEANPMFVTALSMTESNHTPVDAGGPYKAVWELVSEEIMTTESEKPNFHRNPMFVLTDSKDRKVMIPNRQCGGFAHLYKFLGTIMGHMARAKSPMSLDLSPFVWKVMVGEPVTLEDYFTDVDGYFKPLIEDDALLEDDARASDTFEHFSDHLAKQGCDDINARRRAATESVLHFLDAQLNPLREGLATVLGEDVLAFMSWRDLERGVCGDPNPTFEQVKESISCSLPEPQQTMFWEALKELTPVQWSQFFGFCSAQRRYPLSKKIVVVGDSHASVKHLPVAQTCFSQLRVPLYTSRTQFVDQLKKCIVSQEMEFA